MASRYPLIDFDPVAISIGPLSIHWYGVMYLLAFLAFWSIGSRLAASRTWCGWSKEDVGDMLFYGMLGVILGGRVGYMLVYGHDLLLQDPLSLFKIWDGGMSFHGGLLGVIVAMGLFARRKRYTFWQVADFVAPLAPIGLAFGRLGNFIGGELWGRLTDVPWAMIFARATGFAPDRALAMREAWRSGALDHLARHPSQLYEAGLEGVMLFAIMLWYSARKRPPGAVSGLFLLGYGCFRIFAEFFRQPDSQIGFLALNWLTMGMLLSLPMVLAGLVIMLLAYRASGRKPAG